MRFAVRLLGGWFYVYLVPAFCRAYVEGSREHDGNKSTSKKRNTQNVGKSTEGASRRVFNFSISRNKNDGRTSIFSTKRGVQPKVGAHFTVTTAGERNAVFALGRHLFLRGGNSALLLLQLSKNNIKRHTPTPWAGDVAFSSSSTPRPHFSEPTTRY